jgi:hypothetical protein
MQSDCGDMSEMYLEEKDQVSTCISTKFELSVHPF